MEARINRRSFVFGASCSLCGSMILPSCTQVPLTNRSQLNLYDSNLPIILMGGGVLGTPKIYPNERSLNKEVEKTYSKFLSKAKEDKILLDNTDESKKIEEIGKEIYTSLDTSSPLIIILPDCTFSRPAMSFNKVVFPLPDGPKIQEILSLLRLKLILFKIFLLLIE